MASAAKMRRAFDATTQPDGPPALGATDPTTGRVIFDPKRTLPTAERFVRDFYDHADGRTLHAHGGVLLAWAANRYIAREDAAVRHQLQPYLHGALRPRLDKQRNQVTLVDFEANPSTIGQALESVRTLVHLPEDTVSPSWLDGRESPQPNELIPCLGQTLHVPTGTVLAPTPALFNVNALDFNYDPDAPEPQRWLELLEQLFGDDSEAVELLQEFIGYCLTGDTSLQKALLMVGPKRSGKGTIGRLLTRLVGASNVANPTTNGLAGPFGLQALVGKSLAIVSDARFVGDATSIVVERLLNITGEDALTVERKFLPALHLKLPTRFVVLTNELPRFPDSSGALAGRFLVLRLTKSFYGNEDPLLTDKLVAELPGILLWALDGWRRLRTRGCFHQPQSAVEAIRDLEDLASPHGAFVRDRCLVGAGRRVDVDDIYRAWKAWCEQEGRTSPGTKQSFGRGLTAAVAGVKRKRGSLDVPFYEGIGLQ